jgi:hypothetical protein
MIYGYLNKEFPAELMKHTFVSNIFYSVETKFLEET